MKSNFHIKWVRDANMEFHPKTNPEGKLDKDEPQRQSFIQIGGAPEVTPEQEVNKVKHKM